MSNRAERNRRVPLPRRQWRHEYSTREQLREYRYLAMRVRNA